MSDGWFTEPGKTGIVTVTSQEDEWFVTKPATDTQTKCILQNGFNISEDSSTQTLEITVSKFMRAAGNGPNYLFAVPDSEEGSTQTTGTNESSESSAAKSSNLSPKKCSLAELSGSGDYITVEAIVDDVFWVEKDKPNVPDIIGVLRDKESGEKRMFIVNEGVKHPYLEEGRKFVFRGAKDHFYKRENKVQVMITRHTGFTDKGPTNDRSKPTSRTSSNPQSKSSQKKSSSGKNLHKIARTMLGGEEFEMKQDTDSTVGKAKKQAKRQQRDPAIDPKLNGGR